MLIHLEYTATLCLSLYQNFHHSYVYGNSKLQLKKLKIVCLILDYIQFQVFSQSLEITKWKLYDDFSL